jgi:glycosyl transferase family 2
MTRGRVVRTVDTVSQRLIAKQLGAGHQTNRWQQRLVTGGAMNEVHTLPRAGRPNLARSRARVTTSIVVPVFDEMHRLPDALPGLLALADARTDERTEVIFVDDGSRDGTSQFLAERVTPGVSIFQLERHRGKGAAVRAGMRAARGMSTMFMDADLATDVAGVGTLLSALQGAHMAIGSRSHPQSVLLDTTKRRSHLGSQFNRLTQRVTAIELCDTQCGFKAFQAAAAKLLFHFARVDGFAFDVELLCLARSLGLRIAEVPVVWTEMRGSKVRPVRDPLRMASDVLWTRVRSGLRGAIAVCRVRSRTCDAREVFETVGPALRVGDVVTTSADHVDVVLPGTALSAAESVATRMRAVVPDADAAVAPVPAHRLLRELRAVQASGDATGREAPAHHRSPALHT